MSKQNGIINRENIIWIFFLISAAMSLYTALGILALVVMMFLTCAFYFKKYKKIIDRGLIFLVIYLPFYTLFRLGIIFLDVAFISTIINFIRDIVILVLFIDYLIKKHMIYKKDYIWIFFVGNWALGLLVSLVFGNVSLGVSGIHLSVIPMLLYLIISYGEFKIDACFFEKIFLRTATIVAIEGIMAYFFRPVFYGQLFTLNGLSVDASTYVRFSSVFFSPNVCGCYFATSFALAMVRYFFTKNKKYLLLSGLFLSSVILTLSRGAWLYVAMVLFLLCTVVRPYTGVKGISFAIILLLGILILIPNWTTSDNWILRVVSQRFASILDMNNESSYGRINAWVNAINILKQYPLGVGLGAATTAQIGRESVAGIGVIDGFYIKTIVETGMAGCIYCVCFICWCIKTSFYSWLNKKDEISEVALYLICGYLMQSLGSNTFDFICTAPWVWIVLGFSVKSRKRLKIKVDE